MNKHLKILKTIESEVSFTVVPFAHMFRCFTNSGKSEKGFFGNYETFQKYKECQTLTDYNRLKA